MKIKALIAGVALAASALPAHAELSATGGFVSDYYFRGVNLGDGGAYASLDYSAGGFYAGTWWIDDGAAGNDGLETDFYLGYGMEHDAFSWNIGYNRYEYTYASSFEHELDLTLSLSGFSLDIIKGSADSGEDNVDDEDYTVFIAGYSAGAFGVTLGSGEFDDIDDSGWNWAEVSFSGDIVEGISAGLTIGIMSDDADAQDDGYMVFDVSKSFDL
ncbi:hypothetical protein TDB9533_02556 [Thalassocella blandensis]|nr:hypothetical protein TDB9533_02556 [Thalassocella blandensis]